ncbi:MAG: dihydrolipoamide acetyltransferase family protein [SAR202 cluster bacterium]|nr:dihydrolipoamide acetyltransferase family protein [SAR202 cluster bacterium]
MATPIVMPKLGDFMTEGTVVRLAKAQGDTVGQGEVIAEIETEKLNYDLEATQGGIFHPVVDEGANVEVAGIIAYMLAEGEAPPEAPQAQAQASAAASPAAAPPPRRAAPASSGDVVPSTPGARRLAANLGVELSQVAPSGPRGRIVEADVRAFAEAQQTESAPKLPPGLPTPSESKPLRGMRQTIARHMKDSLANSAQLSYSLELDVTEAQRMRREASQGNDTITLADVLMKACAETLKRVGAVNSVLVDGTAHYFDQVNIGLAVALGDGLIVPVIQDVGNLNLQQISEAATDVSTKARDSKLSVNDVVGATFTISVLGTVDVFTPILNPPENGILGVGRSVEKPVVRGGEVVIREMMTVTLTADHQVIDGAVAASFLRRLQATVERPAALFR